MGENGKACQIFIHVFLRDKDKISNIELHDGTADEKGQYLKFLWKEGLTAKGKYNIRKALSNESRPFMQVFQNALKVSETIMGSAML